MPGLEAKGSARERYAHRHRTISGPHHEFLGLTELLGKTCLKMTTPVIQSQYSSSTEIVKDKFGFDSEACEFREAFVVLARAVPW